MDFTQTQKYEILRDQLKKDNGFEELIKASMEIMMRAEQEEYIKQTELYRNGYRPRKVYGCGKVFELRVPRVRGGAFYPLILGILKQQEEEARDSIRAIRGRADDATGGHAIREDIWEGV